MVKLNVNAIKCLSKYFNEYITNKRYEYNDRIKKTDIIDGFLFNLLHTQKNKKSIRKRYVAI